VRGQAGDTAIAVKANLYIQSVGGKTTLKTLGPFDKGRAAIEGLVEADLIGLVRIAEPVEVEMGQGKARGVIELDQGEGRAGDLLVRGGQGADQGAGEGRLSGPQRPAQADGLAGPQAGGQGGAEGLGSRLVCQIEGQGGGQRDASGSCGRMRST
jgi:hypothetical protein